MSYTKPVLVAGGAGFIGSHLVDSLLAKGREVIILDNLSTGNKQNLDLSNPNLEFIRHDITEPISLEVGEIYNLACPASPVAYQNDPIQTLKTNFLGTLNMLNLACKNKTFMVQASTSEVYGDPLKHPQSEEYWGNVNTLGPRACYDEGKRVAESLCWEYSEQLLCHVSLVRIFNTYGPRMEFNDGRVVSEFVLQALRGMPLTVYGKGDQTRSFCYVQDTVRGLIACMERGHTGKVYNIGNPIEKTILDLAHLVKRMTQSKSQIEYMDLPVNDPIRRKPVILKAERELGWKPLYDLEYGLCEMINDFKNRGAEWKH